MHAAVSWDAYAKATRTMDTLVPLANTSTALYTRALCTLLHRLPLIVEIAAVELDHVGHVDAHALGNANGTLRT